MLKMKATVLRTRKELLTNDGKYVPYAAFCYVPWEGRPVRGVGPTPEDALRNLQEQVVKTLSDVEYIWEHEIEVMCPPVLADKEQQC